MYFSPPQPLRYRILDDCLFPVVTILTYKGCGGDKDVLYWIYLIADWTPTNYDIMPEIFKSRLHFNKMGPK